MRTGKDIITLKDIVFFLNTPWKTDARLGL